MTGFADLELLYNQFFNIARELKTFADTENFNEIKLKIDVKNKLIKKLYSAQKTAELNEEEKQKITILAQKLQKLEQNNLEYLKELQTNVSSQLNKTRKKVKVNNAYAKNIEKKQGSILDIVE